MPRILVIDDEVQIRMMLRKTLEHAGYQVMDAPNGVVGMELFHEETFDLVITDILMPEKEGIEIIGELRDHSPETKIIVVSGGSLNINPSNLLRSAKMLGAHGALLKPFEREDLLNTVRHVLNSDKK